MNKVRRANSITRMARRFLYGMPDRKYVVSGDRACGEMMRNARRRRRVRDTEDESILAWARFELRREILDGFWDKGAAYTACPSL